MKNDTMANPETLPQEALEELAKAQIAVELGFSDFDELRATLKPQYWMKKRLEQAQASAKKEYAAQLAQANEALTYALEQAFSGLTEQQIDAVCAVCETPLEILKSINALKASWSEK